MTRRWLLEYDDDDEIYVEPDSQTTEASLERHLSQFDGRSRFYCALFDDADESCMWCYGEPTRRIVEVRLYEGRAVSHFVLAHDAPDGGAEATVRYGVNPDEVVTVPEVRLFSLLESIEVFRLWFRERRVDEGYRRCADAGLFK